jgi:hypothetical protein
MQDLSISTFTQLNLDARHISYTSGMDYMERVPLNKRLRHAAPSKAFGLGQEVGKPS